MPLSTEPSLVVSLSRFYAWPWAFPCVQVFLSCQAFVCMFAGLCVVHSWVGSLVWSHRVLCVDLCSFRHAPPTPMNVSSYLWEGWDYHEDRSAHSPGRC